MRTYWGFSSEWKPSPSDVGDLFIEKDTCRIYEYNSSGEWQLTVSLNNIITGGTYDVGTQTLSLVQFNGCPITIMGIGGGSGTFTGGTVNGPTTFTTGVTFNSFVSFSGIARTSAFSASCTPGNVTVLSVNTSNINHRSIHLKYVLDDGTNMRAGNFVLVSDGLRSGTNYDYTDTSTNDIGNTVNYVLIGSTSGGINQIIVQNNGISSVNIFSEYTLI